MSAAWTRPAKIWVVFKTVIKRPNNSAIRKSSNSHQKFQYGICIECNIVFDFVSLFSWLHGINGISSQGSYMIFKTLLLIDIVPNWKKACGELYLNFSDPFLSFSSKFEGTDPLSWLLLKFLNDFKLRVTETGNLKRRSSMLFNLQK